LTPLAEFAGYGGENLFYDHVHLNFHWQLPGWRCCSRRKWKKALAGSAKRNDSPWLTETELARRLAYTGFDENRVGQEMRARMQQPPFTTQSNFRARGMSAGRAGGSPRCSSAPGGRPFSNYQAALALAPEDWVFAGQFFARFAWKAAGDNSGGRHAVGRSFPVAAATRRRVGPNLGSLAPPWAGDTGHARNFLGRPR